MCAVPLVFGEVAPTPQAASLRRREVVSICGDLWCDLWRLVVTCGESERTWRHRAPNSLSRFVSSVFDFHCFCFLLCALCFCIFHLSFLGGYFVKIQYVYSYLFICGSIVCIGVGVYTGTCAYVRVCTYVSVRMFECVHV